MGLDRVRRGTFPPRHLERDLNWGATFGRLFHYPHLAAEDPQKGCSHFWRSLHRWPQLLPAVDQLATRTPSSAGSSIVLVLTKLCWHPPAVDLAVPARSWCKRQVDRWRLSCWGVVDSARPA